MRDLDLVKFALKNMNGKEMRSIADSFSPNFVFSTPRFKSLNFEQYCEYIDFLSTVLELTAKDIKHDNGLFTIDATFNILDISEDYQKSLTATGKVFIQNNLVQSLAINYEAKGIDFKIITKISAAIMRHLKNAFLNK